MLLKLSPGPELFLHKLDPSSSKSHENPENPLSLVQIEVMKHFIRRNGIGLLSNVLITYK